jgi:ribosomal protein S18 acetylase RimI-like enzyme
VSGPHRRTADVPHRALARGPTHALLEAEEHAHPRRSEADLPALIDLTIAAFRPLFERDLPQLLDPLVYAHDHGSWKDGYRKEVPSFHDPKANRFITLAEDSENSGRVLGYVGWQSNHDGSGRLQMVAVHPQARRQGVGSAVCLAALAHLKLRGVTVVHIGTGGDAFHAPARSLYESLGFTGYPVVDFTRGI